MIKIEKEEIVIGAKQVGEEFSKADCFEQTQFLLGMVRAIPSGAWSMQCKYIAEEFDENDLFYKRKTRVINYLTDLIEHLNEK